MRALLVIAVVVTFVSVTSSAEAQWLRSRRTSSCANGQCGLNSADSVATEEVSESQPAASEAPTAPAAPEAAPAPAAEPAPAAAAAPAASPANESQAATANSSRTRSANAVGGRFWRRLRSRL